jgi:aspartyl/glutamyl-tRNA(Asn/Gln) amidotransferase C subunit
LETNRFLEKYATRLASLTWVGYTPKMSDEITPELFNHLAELAALELSAGETEYLRRQLNNQLKAIHELETIPLDPETPVASHGVSYTSAISPALRADEPNPYPHPAALIAIAPETEDGYVIAPDIPHQDLKPGA